MWIISALVLLFSTIWLKEINQRGLEAKIPATKNNLKQAFFSADADSTSGTLANQKIKNASFVAASTTITTAEINQEAVSSSLPAKETIPVSFKFQADGWTKQFSLDVVKGDTVYEAMKQLNDKQLIEIIFKQFGGGLGAFVQSIGGVENSVENNKFWIYYINDKKANLGISSIKLNSNDLITWKYEKGEF